MIATARNGTSAYSEREARGDDDNHPGPGRLSAAELTPLHNHRAVLSLRALGELVNDHPVGDQAPDPAARQRGRRAASPEAG